MKKNLLTFLMSFIITAWIYGQNYPAGFAQVQVVNGISNPTTFDFAPDGRIFVCQQDGALRVIKNGSLLPTPALDLDVDMNGERGLDGIIVHPDFLNNHYVYLYYTVAATPKRNKLSRFTFSGDIINPSSEVVILELDPLNTSNIHNSGCMRFSQDGKLFVSVGENNNSANAQNLDSYMGKILRINPDGSAPADNPFASGATPQRKRVWAMGLRNPFTFDIDPVTGKIYVNEVGHALWEEINDATSPGVNFGWPIDQGIVTGTTYTNPVFAYAHDNADLTGCAITGGTFFRPKSSNYPSSYVGKYFFMDYCSNFIRTLDPKATSQGSTSFATNIPSNSLSIKTGPDGNLYFLSRTTGELNKIIYTQNTAPIISVQPQSATVAVAQAANFSIVASGLPPFTYQWKKNGLNIPGATSASYALNSVTLNDSGTYTVVVNNTSGTVTSSAATLTVKNTTPPVASIDSPSPGITYKGGDVINFSGSATDAEDGPLPASAYTWKVEFWHGTGTHQHVHDGPPIAQGVKSGSFTIPANNETATDVFYRLILTVKDSEGITATKTVDLTPRFSTITLATNPPGFRLLLEGEPRNTTLSFQSVEGIQRTLGVITPQSLNGTNYKFDKWSIGGESTQIINTPENDVTYTAFFVEDNDLREPDNPGAVTSGVTYNYYEGSWLVLPDFNTLTPVKTGTVGTFTLDPKNRDINYAFKFTGYIDIPADGIYRFYTNSNDGSKLFIGDRLIVNNDGQHANVEMSGTVGLKSGKHQITVIYFQYNGANSLTVSYSSDGIIKQEIPASRLLHPTGGSGNMSPSVSLTSPAANQQFDSGSTIVLAANATDSDGSIGKVEFYQGTVKLGEDLNAPYQYSWSNVPDGTYSISAKAYDNQNASAVSMSIVIKVFFIVVRWVIV